MNIKIFLFLIIFIPRNSFPMEFPQRSLLLENFVKEYELKAVFLYHFLRYFEWEERENLEFYEIAVFGKNEITKTLKEIAEKKIVKGKKIKIREIYDLEEIGNPHILFIPRERGKKILEIVNKINFKPILIVGEEEGLLLKGASVNFILVEDRVKFEINCAILKRCGIKPSSQILKLAISLLTNGE